MENWRNIHPDFTEELQGDWEDWEFSYDEIKEWIVAGLTPQDAEFASFLYNNGYRAESLNDNILKEKRKEYTDGIEKWKNINQDFGYGSQLQWEEKGFTYDQIREWVDASCGKDFSPKFINFFLWLRDTKKTSPKELLEHKNLSELVNEYNLLFWKNIHPEFTPRLQKLWEQNKFNLEQVRQWINKGLTTTDYDFANYLKKEGHNPKQELNLTQLRIEHAQNLDWKNIHWDFLVWQQEKWEKAGFTYTETKLLIEAGLNLHEYDLATYLKKDGYDLINLTSIDLKESRKKISWESIHPEFRYWHRKDWESKDFNKEQTKEWIATGAKIDDYEFVAWLKDIKNYGSEWIINYKEDYQILSERFKKYGLCSECNQPNTGEQWCQPCNLKHSITRFAQLNKSHNPQIDQFIQKYQLVATDADKFIEWIPYEQFTEIEYLAEGGFGKVYKAKWKAGNVHHWDAENKQWHREKDYTIDEEDKKKQDYKWNKDKYKKHKNYREVVLKSLTNSQENTDFLQESEKHKIIDDWFNNIVPCYGLSQNPNTGNYLMVMQYMPEGNLRHYLSNKSRELSLEDKFNHLVNIAQGLKDIHAKNLVHRDFHSGNILKGIEKTDCLITDLGLCKPASETNDKKIFGVLPYVAPEVLQSKPYTQAADIYSFGIIAYELLTGISYYDELREKVSKEDMNLGLRVCQGFRPEFKIKIPQLLEDLIKRCWDDDLAKRPTANELEKALRNWQNDTEFKNQIQVAEEFNKTLPEEIKFPKYKKYADHHSKLLPTKEITQLLQTSQETFGSSTISMTGLLDNLVDASLEDKQTEQQAQIIHNPPKNTP